MIALDDDVKGRLLEVADWIEKDPARFAMGDFESSGHCGTVACIAGWAVFLERRRTAGLDVDVPLNRGVGSPYRSISGVAEGLLGGNTVGNALFYLSGWPASYFDAFSLAADGDEEHEKRAANAALAARLLREVVERGGIWWFGIDADGFLTRLEA